MQSTVTHPPRPRSLLRTGVGVAVLAVAAGYLAAVVDLAVLRTAAGEVAGAPLTVSAAVLAYAAAFGLRTWAWCHVLPGLSAGQSWAALHVSLLGNHLLPLRLGEVLRVTSVRRRTALPLAPVLSSAVLLRASDLLALLLLATLAAPALLGAGSGGLVSVPAAGLLAGLLLVVLAAAVLWMARLARAGAALRLPGPAVAGSAVAAWLLESTVLLAVADAAGLSLSYGEAVAVTAVTILTQAVAVTPGGFGSYEAAGTAALVAAGVPAAQGLAVVLLAHALKTGYALLLGLPALVVPAPGYLGRWRLPSRLPDRPSSATTAQRDPAGPVVVFLPAYDEQATVGEVVARLPRRVQGRPVHVLVVDDGSTDATAEVAERAGARVVRLWPNQGLGAAVRRGLAEATALNPACVVYLDADGEYPPEALASLAAPVLDGTADYVVGSRFAGTIETMRPHRRLGNTVLTAWVRWMTRRPDLTDGQSGYRAFSPAAAAAADIVHDYNYAQVLTLDLLGKGFGYAEVPIRYRFRTTGTSFVRLHRYLRRVLPAVHAQLNPPPHPRPPSPPHPHPRPHDPRLLQPR